MSKTLTMATVAIKSEEAKESVTTDQKTSALPSASSFGMKQTLLVEKSRLETELKDTEKRLLDITSERPNLPSEPFAAEAAKYHAWAVKNNATKDLLKQVQEKLTSTNETLACIDRVVPHLWRQIHESLKRTRVCLFVSHMGCSNANSSLCSVRGWYRWSQFVSCRV